MSNVSKKTIIKSAVLAFVISTAIATTANAEVTRLGGPDRYSTSEAIVKAGWPQGSSTAILASALDANIVDSLTVAPLAKAKNAPIILVDPHESITKIVAKFTTLKAKTVYIASGTGVISTQVEAALKAAGISTVYRLGGVDRYETAVNIAKFLGGSGTIAIASGDNAHLVDSLSIAPIAAAKGIPILLASNILDKATTDYIKDLGAKTTYVLGGTSVVTDSAVSSLQGVTRLAGTGRYETNAIVVNTFKTDSALNLNNIFIASGEDANLVDALAGAPLAASVGAPIVFVHDTINPAVNILLESIVTGTTKITELGGTGAVTTAAEDAIKKIQMGVVTFPDKNLEKIIRNTIPKPTGDILKSDVENIKKLNSNNDNITNLAGIENFTNLTELSLLNNPIRDVEPLRGLTNLTSLQLSYSKISNIEPLGGLSKLTELSLLTNQISNIEPLRGLTNLTRLNLEFNTISNLAPLKGLSKLTYLELSTNRINDIEPLGGLTNLTSLNLVGNHISNIVPLEGLTKLYELYLTNNQVSNIEPLRGLSNLTRLILLNNQISNIEPLRGLTNLHDLYLDNNQISNIEPLKGLTNLNMLILSSNQIINIEALKGLTKLSILNLTQNQIINIDALKRLTNLTELYLSNNQIKDYSPVSAYYNNLKQKDFTLN